MDFKYEKVKSMSEPMLYKVGIDGKLFNNKVFWGW